MEDEMILDGAIISASFDEALETVSDGQHLYLCQFFPIWMPLFVFKKEAELHSNHNDLFAGYHRDFVGYIVVCQLG